MTETVQANKRERLQFLMPAAFSDNLDRIKLAHGRSARLLTPYT